MPVFRLNPTDTLFPKPALAEKDGLLAVGGDLSPKRLIAAYMNGIFPWYSDDSPILWWSPDPRFVLYPEKIKISKSMAKVLKKGEFRITVNSDFRGVIEACKKVERPGQPGTWITEEMMRAYIVLHKLGYAVSVEAWQGEMLAGGLYGVVIGRAFFGESMFSLLPDASKTAFITFAGRLRELGFPLIDCQVHTKHLESLGAEHIPLKKFLNIISAEVVKEQCQI